MLSARPLTPLAPTLLALSQLDDPIFLGVVVRSVLWSIACFVLLHFGAIWAVQSLLHLHGWSAWVVGILSSIGASVLSLWLFLPVAAAIGTLYFDRIAYAVENRHYPFLPTPKPAPLFEQVWDGLAVAMRVLLLNIVTLLLAFMIPGIGLVLGWM